MTILEAVQLPEAFDTLQIQLIQNWKHLMPAGRER